MTREEHIENLKKLKSFHNGSYGDSIRVAIKALEQEPCEDVISREDALMALTGEWTELTDEIIHRFIKRIKSLPSVNPQPKIGHWIDGHCSKCGCDVPAYIVDWKWQKDMDAKYCPNCGAIMIEPQESEGEE